MTAAGDAVLATSYSCVGMTENPPNSNLCSPFTDAWGAGAWCAMFISWCCAETGYPVPPINGPAGFSYCPDGNVYAHSTGHAVGEGGVENGDILIFSWEPFYYGSDGIAYCAYGVYAGSPAGDHTGFFAGWLGDGYMRTVEGNTSQSSWDNGGAVMERTDRYTGQICCYARHALLNIGGGGGGTAPPQEEDEDDEMMRLLIRHEDGSAYAVDGIKAYPISSGYTLQVLQSTGALMTQAQMDAKGWTWDVDGGSINAAYEIQDITESTPDKM